ATKAGVVFVGQRPDSRENHRPAEAACGRPLVLCIEDRLRLEGGRPVAPLMFLPDLPRPIVHLLFRPFADLGVFACREWLTLDLGGERVACLCCCAHMEASIC